MKNIIIHMFPTLKFYPLSYPMKCHCGKKQYLDSSPILKIKRTDKVIYCDGIKR